MKNETLIVDCEVAHNYSGWSGAIDARGETDGEGTLILRCEVHDNKIYDYTTGHGGGIYIKYGKVYDCFVYNNCITNYKGAIYATDGGGIYAQETEIVGCTVSNNICGAAGGGIIVMYRGLVEDCTICDNYSHNVGGGIASRQYMTYTNIFPKINNCIIYNNFAEDSGGGLFSHRMANVKNCLIFDNHSLSNGGGVDMWFGGKLENSTIVDNSCDGVGGGDGARFFNWDKESGWGGKTAVSNCIFYFNGDENVVFNSTNTSVDYSCVTPAISGHSGVGNITSAPDFVNRAGRNYRLNSSSPCINAGHNNPWMTDPTNLWSAYSVSLDGWDRILDGTVDMGAYETPVAFACTFSAFPLVTEIDKNIDFTALVGGANSSSATFSWDFDNDGTIDLTGTDNEIVHSYPDAGIFTVSLSATNGVGEGFTKQRFEYIEIIPEPFLFINCYLIFIIYYRRKLIFIK